MFVFTLGDLIEYGFLAVLGLGIGGLVLVARISGRRARRNKGSLGK